MLRRPNKVCLYADLIEVRQFASAFFRFRRFFMTISSHNKQIQVAVTAGLAAAKGARSVDASFVLRSCLRIGEKVAQLTNFVFAERASTFTLMHSGPPTQRYSQISQLGRSRHP